MDLLEKLEGLVLGQTTTSEREIAGMWATDCLFNPAQNGRIFKYKFIIAQTQIGQGCAYSSNENYNADCLAKLVGKDCLDNEIKDLPLRVACLDSLCERISFGYEAEEINLNGTSAHKLRARTELIIKEAERLMGDLRGKKVLNVGVVGDIIFQFYNHGCSVIGSDFDPTIVGKHFFKEVPIISGTYTLEALKNVDIAVVTGMTIANATLNKIIAVCKEFGVKLIVFAETGSNMGQFYVREGIDCYLGEIFPFYIFNGISTIRITRDRKL